MPLAATVSQEQTAEYCAQPPSAVCSVSAAVPSNPCNRLKSLQTATSMGLLSINITAGDSHAQLHSIIDEILISYYLHLLLGAAPFMQDYYNVPANSPMSMVCFHMEVVNSTAFLLTDWHLGMMTLLDCDQLLNGNFDLHSVLSLQCVTMEESSHLIAGFHLTQTFRNLSMMTAYSPCLIISEMVSSLDCHIYLII